MAEPVAEEKFIANVRAWPRTEAGSHTAGGPGPGLELAQRRDADGLTGRRGANFASHRALLRPAARHGRALPSSASAWHR